VIDASAALLVVVGVLAAAIAAMRMRSCHTLRLGIPVILAALNDAVVVLDPLGRVLEINPRAEAMLAHKAEDEGRRLLDTFFGARWDNLLQDEVVSAQTGIDRQVITVASGQVYEVRMSYMAKQSGRPAGTVVVMRDVTEVERLHDELAELSIRDELTGLYNRRHLRALLATAVRQASGSGRALSAVIVDIDHLEEVNDEHGREVGDELLVSIANELAAGTLEGDTLARYVGKWFVILLSGADADAARAYAELCRERCSQVQVASAEGRVATSISAGVAQLPASGSGELLLAIAEEALSEARAAGGNQVVVHGRQTVATD
jgi:diguanylate cyclase (GGDEF)-like protein